MELMAARAIRILLPLALMTGIWFALRRKTTVVVRLGLAALAVVFALAAYTAADHVSPVRDEVTITALDERNEASLATEILLLGYETDGKEYLSTDDLDLRDGKWSWAEGSYCWRPETDLRQPGGTTRSITIGVPVGWERELCFRTDEYGGVVSVESPEGGVIEYYDTFAAPAAAEAADTGEDTLFTGSVIRAGVGRSSTAALISDQLRRLAVYALVLCGLTAAAVAITVSQDLQRKLKGYFHRHDDTIVYIALAVLMIVAMRFFLQYNDMVWGDELIAMDVAGRRSLREALNLNLWLWDFTPPLFNAICYLVSRMLPHSFSSMMWIPQVFLAISVVVMGKLGKSLFGKKAGVFAAIIAATSASLVLSAGYEIRGYSMYYLWSALTLWTYIQRRRSDKEGFSRKYCGLMTLCFTGLLYSHYFGFMIMGMYFLSDCLLAYRKQCSVKHIISYIVPGLLLVAWIVAVYFSGGRLEYSFAGQPYVVNLFRTVSFLLGGNRLLIAMFVAGCTCLLLGTGTGGRTDKSEALQRYIAGFSAITVALNMLAVYAYSKVSGGGIYKNRYLISLVPFVVVVILFWVDVLGRWTKKNKLIIMQEAVSSALLASFMLFAWNMGDTIMHDMGVQETKIISEENNGRMLYVDIINDLKSREDLCYQKTGVFVPSYEAYSWLLKDGKYADINIENILSEDRVDRYDTIYCVYYNWVPINYMAEYETIINNYTMVENNEYLCIAKYMRNY